MTAAARKFRASSLSTHLHVSVVLLIFGLFAQTSEAGTIHSIYGRTEITPACSAAYLDGQKAYSQIIQTGVVAQGDIAIGEALDAALQTAVGDREDCAAEFSLGAFDAKGLLHQQLASEYMLELQAATKDNYSNQQIQNIQYWFAQRFKMAGMDVAAMKTLDPRSTSGAAMLQQLQDRLHTQALEADQAVPFGRFVFVSSIAEPLTLFEYRFDATGNMQLDASQQPLTDLGSYQRLAESLWRQAKQTAEEYFGWRPGIFYGEDSFLNGALWRAFGVDKGPSPREVKEGGYIRALERITRLAAGFHIDTKPFLALQTAVLQKQRAFLERDMAAFDRTMVGVMAAPLIPVGMYVGAVGFTYAGMSAAASANAAAAFSLGTMAATAGFGGYNAIVDARSARQAGLPFRFIDALDHVVGSMVAAFPLVAAMPAAAGGTVATGKFMVLSAQSFIANGMNIVRTAQTLGWQGSLQALKGMPLQLGRAWVSAWWKNKFLFVHLAVDTSISTVFEIGYRQIFLDGKDKFYFVDRDGNAHFNQQVILNMVTSVIIGGIAKPITVIKSFGGRYVTFRALTFVSSLLSQMIVKGAIDGDRFTFDQVYGGTIGSSVGEFERVIKLSSLVQGLKPGRQYLLLFAFQVAVKMGMTPIKVYLTDGYLNGELHPTDLVIAAMRKGCDIDIADYSREEIEAAAALLKQDPDFQDLLKSDPVAPHAR